MWKSFTSNPENSADKRQRTGVVWKSFTSNPEKTAPINASGRVSCRRASRRIRKNSADKRQRTGVV
jgi:hypothetical protein